MEFPEDVRYHPADTWVRNEANGQVRIGITDFAQDELDEIVYVDLPDEGAELTLGETFGEIESSKTVADLVAPATGIVAEVNGKLEQNPEIVNEDPYGDGWIVVIDLSEPLSDQLLDAAAYRTNTEER